MIEVLDFSKQYKSSFKISGVNFCVRPGQITSLVGANGSGKSTVIKAICGFHYASSGKIFISDSLGNKIDVENEAEKAMALTGYVPEIPKLPSDFYVSDFLLYAAENHGLSGKKLDDSLKELIKKCTLSEVLEKKIRTLSKGFCQRVSLAQALLHDPDNLILDEPVTGLDPLQILEFRSLLKKLSATKSVLISTHIMQEVRELSSNIVILGGGRQLACGSEKEIISKTGFSSIEELLLKGGRENEKSD